MSDTNGKNVSGEAAAEITVETITASKIQSKPISFLLNPYIPLGAVTALFGDGGCGKSFVTCAIAAAISRGQLIPGTEESFPISDVIIQNAENGWANVLKPRLEMLGADCSKIHSIDDTNKRLTITDERIEAAIRKHNAKYFVIDPIQSYLPESFSMNRVESVRPVLTHLAGVAERTESAIMIVGHISKGRGKAQHKGLGSVDMINAVPSALLMGRAEELRPDERIIAHMKGNFTELGLSIKFSLKKGDGFNWLGVCDIIPDEIISYNARKAKENKDKVDEAIEFLYEILSEGEISASEAIALAVDVGISKRTLDRARKEINVNATKTNGPWVWSLQGCQH